MINENKDIVTKNYVGFQKLFTILDILKSTADIYHNSIVKGLFHAEA